MSASTPYTVGPAEPMTPADERLWATLTHIGGLFFGFIPALIVYLVLKDRAPFVRQHSASALNFQLTMLIVAFAGSMLWFLVLPVFAAVAAAILVIVFSIIAAVAANRGEWYTYPLSIRFVS